ncbi:MAG: MFS transporter [Clostridia bacterium]|jgi:MFS family permease
MKKQHPMIETLLRLKGNPRACVYTEPLWGIPFNLYAPYVSLYMYALGVNDVQIGLVTSIGMVFQILFAFLGGAITDKLGRKRTTFIFDIISWSIPCLIWAFAQNFVFFVVAAIINSTWRVTSNSWMCLMVEDADQDKLVGIYAWVYISGLLAAFFSPIARFFIERYELVPTVRVLYLVAFIMMTSKFVILNRYCTETRQGRIRMAETRNQSIFSILGQYGGVLKKLIHSPATLLTMGIMVVMNICNTVNGAFWPIMVTQRLRIPVENVAIFPAVKSGIMLLLYFFLVPRLSALKFKKPMLLGFGMFIASQLLLISIPEQGYLLLLVSVFLEACSLSLISPLMDSLSVIMVDARERARIMAILHVVIIAFVSPFGWIAGVLSELNRALPFIMNIFLFALGGIFTYYASRVVNGKKSAVDATDMGA